MESIVKQVNNPEWWFTVVIVGLVVGIVAAYAKDWLTAGLSAVSGKYRVYAERRSSRRDAEVSLLSVEPPLLLIEYVRCMLVLAATASLLAASYLLVAWNVLRNHFPDVDPVTRLMALDQIRTWLGVSLSAEMQNLITQLLFGVPGLVLWNHFLNRLSLCEKARKKLRGNMSGK